MTTEIDRNETPTLMLTFWPKDALMRRLHKERRHDLLLSVFGLTGRRLPKEAPGFVWFVVSQPAFLPTFNPTEILGPFETIAEAKAFVRSRDAKSFALPAYAQSLIEGSAK